MLYIRPGFIALCPAIVSALFYRCNKKAGFSKLPEKVKQGIYGIVFGILAVLCTRYGISFDGFIVSARDAVPLCAGLIFGAPAGVLAGLIGGIEGYFAALRDAGTYAGIGSVLTIFLAGCLGAVMRKWMFEGKRPVWHYGIAVSFVLEVINCTLVFFENIENVRQAFALVESCVLPLVALNVGSVSLAMLTVSAMSGDFSKARRKRYKLQLAQIFSRWLMVCVALAFVVSSMFIYILQTRLAISKRCSGYAVSLYRGCQR